MNEKKMISIDQFSAEERLAVDETFNRLVQKYRLRSGKEPDSKKEKELLTEARQTIMAGKQEKEEAKARATSKPPRKKKPETLTEKEVKDFSWSASVVRGRR